MDTFGILDSSNSHIDVSRTEKGAKNYATRNGYKVVSIRYRCGYDVDIVATKQPSGRWAKAGSKVRRAVYRVMLGKTELMTFFDELAAHAYMHNTKIKESITLKKGYVTLQA